jgi:ribonuclease-3
MTATGAKPYALLENQLGYIFRDAALCEAALTHKSWLNETNLPDRTDNERLEFLGDAVLALVVSDLLMRRFPQRPEGELSKARAVIVSEVGLTKAAEALGLGQWIFLGRGEDQAGGRRKPSILSNALEALIGAVYLDGGFAAAHDVAHRLFATDLAEAEGSARLDFKSRLQERSQALLQVTPQYSVVAEAGPDHDKTFSVVIRLGGIEYGPASGKSKKEAEQNAAAQALTALENRTA